MRLTIKKKIGKTIYPFTFEGDNLHDVIMESSKLSFGDVQKCGVCGSEHLILDAHVAQGYKYTEIKCLACKAQLVFGKRRDDDSVYFLRKNDNKEYDWTKYESKDVGKPLNQQKGGSFEATNDSDPLPF